MEMLCIQLYVIVINYKLQSLQRRVLIQYFLGPGLCNPDAKRLFDDLLSSYNKLVRPVMNVTDAVTVKFKLKLSQLIDVVSSLVKATKYEKLKKIDWLFLKILKALNGFFFNLLNPIMIAILQKSLARKNLAIISSILVKFFYRRCNSQSAKKREI